MTRQWTQVCRSQNKLTGRRRLTPQQLWATHDTLMWVQQTGVLGNPHHPLFTRIGTIRQQSAKVAHHTIVAGMYVRPKRS
jgi:hypothetical protein